MEPENPSCDHESFNAGAPLRHVNDVTTTIDDNDNPTFVTEQ
jgi:hypothetical protein